MSDTTLDPDARLVPLNQDELRHCLKALDCYNHSVMDLYPDHSSEDLVHIYRHITELQDKLHAVLDEIMGEEDEMFQKMIHEAALRDLQQSDEAW
jgi:hypothetical protein